MIQTPGDANRAGVIFGFRKPKTTRQIGRKSLANCSFSSTTRAGFGYTDLEQVVSPCAHEVRRAGLEPAIPVRSPVESRVRLPVSPPPQVWREGELPTPSPVVFIRRSTDYPAFPLSFALASAAKWSVNRMRGGPPSGPWCAQGSGAGPLQANFWLCSFSGYARRWLCRLKDPKDYHVPRTRSCGHLRHRRQPNLGAVGATGCTPLPPGVHAPHRLYAPHGAEPVELLLDLLEEHVRGSFRAKARYQRCEQIRNPAPLQG